MRIALVDYLERVIAYQPHADAEQQEKQRVFNNVERLRIGSFKPDNKGEDDNSDNVVDYRRAHNKRAYLAL